MKNTGFRDGWLTSQDGLRLYYRDYGDAMNPATPVLCLPGVTRNSKDFALLAEWLSVHRWVICPDFRGRGRSDYDPDWKNYMPATYADDIRHLLVSLGVHRVHVIGTSLGGIVAMVMAGGKGVSQRALPASRTVALASREKSAEAGCAATEER